MTTLYRRHFQKQILGREVVYLKKNVPGDPIGIGQVRLGVWYVIIFLYVQFGIEVHTVASPAVRSENKSRDG